MSKLERVDPANTGANTLFLQNVTDTFLGNVVVNGVVQQPGAAGVNPFVTSITTSGVSPDGSLASQASATFFVTRTVQAGDSDLTTSVTTYVYNDAADFSGEQITATANTSVDLFQPSATMTVTANPTTATSLGTPITYTFTVTNTSSADSPNLVLDASPNNSFTDTLLGDLEADAIAVGGGSVAPGGSFTFTETRAIQAGDPTPLTNTATVVFTLAQNLGNFSNQITANASASVTLLPHLTITKAITDGVDVIHPGDTASFTITVTNDGAGPATNVLVTDQLPAADQLTWTFSSSSFDTTSVSTGDFLTASSATLAAGATASVTVRAVIPLDIFGTTGGGTGSGDPVAAGVFELDGNVTTGVLGTSGSTTTSHDWDQVFADAVNGTSTSGAVAVSFVTDAVNTNGDDIFTGGGSKDTQGIQQGPWLFTDSKPQAKNDITHAYAATYTDPSNGHVLLFAGLDRFDNSGDATAGFWFFQNPVSGGGTVSGSSHFTGTHADGDILLVSDFTQGGSVSTVKVFRWTGNDATGSLVAVSAPGTTTFAVVNSGSIAVPWSFMDKSHHTNPAAGEFLEEGVDLTALGLGGCFSNFMAETRSSQSPTATLSDFVIGSFNTCRLDLPNTATVSADGIAPITSNQVVISVVDGDMLQAESVGHGTIPAGLTMQDLPLALARAISEWRAAGVDPRALSGLDNVTYHVVDLPRAELGLSSPGEIWIDRTAAGWGWSTDGAPGRMDLTTVLTHELGHALGFEHNDAGVMEFALAPGVQRVPAAGADTGTAGTIASVSGLASGTAQARGLLTAPSRAEAMEFGSATRGGATAMPAAIVLRDMAGPTRGPVTSWPQATQISPVGAPVSLAPAAELDVNSWLVDPGRQVPITRASGSGEEPGEIPAEKTTPLSEPAGLDEADTAVGTAELLRRLDAYFADPSRTAEPDELAAPRVQDESGAARVSALVLGVLLGGFMVTPETHTDTRQRRRWLV